ncbi:MAG: magnesium chelatase subunit D family protein [Candidatus Helarchaeota archaeon]
MKYYQDVFPFAAIIGQDLMKKALILNAINPKIGGVLIKGEKGTAKSTAARALTELLPKIKVVKNCPFNCNPEDPNEMCSDCKERYEKYGELDAIERNMVMITLPVSATEDRVVGTIDLKKALEDKKLGLEPGILAEVNRGILYIDEVNLLDNHVADLLLDAAAMGYNYIERENISFYHPSKFVLIGTMNPEEGDLRPQLLDRFGLCIEVKGENDLEKRIAIIKARQEFDKNSEAFRKKYEKEQEKLRNKIINAKKILPEVKINENLLKFISLICINLKVDGHRADITIAKTAQTIAAFENRKEVKYEDVKEAMILALPHRLKKLPFKRHKFDLEEFIEFLDKMMEQLKNELSTKKKNGEEGKDDFKQQSQNDSQENSQYQNINNSKKIQEIDKYDEILENKNINSETLQQDKYMKNKLHSNELNIKFNEYPISENQNIENSNNSEEDKKIFEIGEEITEESRKTILKQNIEAIQRKIKNKRNKNCNFNKRGRYIKYRTPFKNEKITDLAIDATLRYALIDSIKNNEEFDVIPNHYRIKIRKEPYNVLIIFLLDTSGSMGVNKRISAAKGAIFSLLKEIYIRKDKVCLITFSGIGADLVLPPTNSVELAYEILEKIPTGGKTPLSAGIYKALQLAISENNNKNIIPLIILLSDGKQNVPLYSSFVEDQEILLELFNKYSIPLVCIDTDLSYFNLGFAKELANNFNAIYYELDKLQSEKISEIISTEYYEITKWLK